MQAPTIALQLYTVRELMNTPEQVTDTLQRIAEIGYRNIEVAGLYDYGPAEFRTLCQDAGLTIVSAHADWTALRDRTDEQIQWLSDLGVKLVATGSPGEYHTGEGYARFAWETNELAAKLADAGITYMYHNHAHEYALFEGRSGMDIMTEESDPKLFQFELDVHWVQRGGASPVAWLQRLSGRIPLLHCKDMSVTTKSEPVFEPVGAGNLDWPPIMAAAAEGGVVHYTVEQDRCQISEFDSIAISYRNLSSWLGGGL